MKTSKSGISILAAALAVVFTGACDSGGDKPDPEPVPEVRPSDAAIPPSFLETTGASHERKAWRLVEVIKRAEVE